MSSTKQRTPLVVKELSPEAATSFIREMQFNVIHRRPKFASKDKETVKAEIEKQLFAFFSKYCTT